MKFALLDLDNCISDDGWRIPKINFQKKGDARYEVYHTLSPFDKLGNSGLVADLIRSGIAIVIMTGRPVLFSEATKEWLKRCRIPIHAIHAMLMRNPGDIRPAHQLKAWQLACLLDNETYGVRREDIVEAHDDHPLVVSMYREQGINAMRTWIHAVDAYVNPLNGERHE